MRARLGIVDIALETKELNDLTTPHGLLSAPELDPKTWKCRAGARGAANLSVRRVRGQD